LLQQIISSGYSFQSFEQFLLKPSTRSIILRNDVDRLPAHALRMAEILNRLGIQATFYFRIVKCSWDENVMRTIVDLRHELGYHYEDFTVHKGNAESAAESFAKNLDLFREFYPVKTICMHGSPLSPWDNRLLWQKLNYRDYGIIGEPYLDLDFEQVLYLTDSGRRWNGEHMIVRDKVLSKYNYNLKSTSDLINAFKQNILPEKIMLTFHPQRWNDSIFDWTMELILQKSKNIIKKYIFVKSDNEA
jgi:hypothetical protein